MATQLQQALVTLSDDKVTILTGDLDVYIGDDGSLRVLDYTPPRDGNGLIFAAVAGQWLRIVVNNINDMAS